MRSVYARASLRVAAEQALDTNSGCLSSPVAYKAPYDVKHERPDSLETSAWARGRRIPIAASPGHTGTFKLLSRPNTAELSWSCAVSRKCQCRLNAEDRPNENTIRMEEPDRVVATKPSQQKQPSPALKRSRAHNIGL